jgi:hypothetical protein
VALSGINVLGLDEDRLLSPDGALAAGSAEGVALPMRTHMRSRSVVDISGNQRGPSAGSFRRRNHQQPSSALIRTHLLISPEIEIDPQSDAIRRNQTQSDLLISPEIEANAE